MILFDQGQRQVHSGCDSCRGVNIFIPNKYWIRIDLCAWGTSDQSFAPAPMGGGAASIEETGATVKHGSGANGANAPAAGGDFSQPAHRFRVYFILFDCVAAGNEQGVDLSAHITTCFVRGKTQTAVRS